MAILTFRDDAMLTLESKPILEIGTKDQMRVDLVLVDLGLVLQVPGCELVLIIVQSPGSGDQVSRHPLIKDVVPMPEAHQFDTPMILARPMSFNPSITAQASLLVRLSFLPLGGKCSNATST